MNNNTQPIISKSAMQKKAKLKKKLLIYGSVILLVILSLVVTYFVQSANNKFDSELSVEEAQKIVDAELSEIPNVGLNTVVYDKDNTYVTVNSIVEYGGEKNVVLDCSYVSYDFGILVDKMNSYFETAYNFYEENLANDKKSTGLDIKLKGFAAVKKDVYSTEKVSGNVQLVIYEDSPGVFKLHKSDEVINTVFCGLIDAVNAADDTSVITIDGKEVDIANRETLRSGVKYCFAVKNYDTEKPDTNIPLIKTWNKFKASFYKNFIYQNRYMYIVNGVASTLALTACALVIGILLGFIVAVIRVINHKTGKLEIAADICKAYLSIMRGMPLMVQIMIIHFAFLGPIGIKNIFSAVICFGLNSGAYVSEIIRGGIMSVDEGQTEAGRSLGFNYIQTMTFIIIPQAFKAVLPALANEFIALLKETSIAFYIGVAELTLAGLRIRSQTYDNYMPLIAVGIVYLIVVLGLSKCVAILERRLSKGDKR